MWRVKRAIEYLLIHSVLVKYIKHINLFVEFDLKGVSIEGSKGINNYRRVPEGNIPRSGIN